MAFEINILAVFGAAVASFALGALWYSPVLFGKRWMTEMGFTKVLFGKRWMTEMGFTKESMKVMKMTPWLAMVLIFFGTFLTSYILAHFIRLSEYLVVFPLGPGGLEGPLSAEAFWGGMQMGFLIWLGFLMPLTLGAMLWENKSWTLFAINASWQFIALMLMSAILSYF